MNQAGGCDRAMVSGSSPRHERSRRASLTETGFSKRRGANWSTAAWSPEGAELHGTGPPRDHSASAQAFAGDPRQDRGGLAHHGQHVGERTRTDSEGGG